MSYIFPTASSISVFLQGFHLELAYQLQFKENQSQVPIYGYNDFIFTKTARSRKFIDGILVLNFTFPGYLNVVLDTLYNDKSAYIPRLYNFDYNPKIDAQKENLIKDIRS